ncbi:PorT family protein [Cruoricaptor ignavus]|uniref:PorT family protein n=1 Tax=Cruoricaptor ignavus TaxID=1118202 RepID=A0A7M1T5F9_9FLAO|nr:porin family protein [Cruoricaptor ignavus]QOR74364.1 PorT family protein [Cruoricaptor ignavus]
MKKLFIFSALAASATAFSQYAEKRSQFGITAGVHGSHIHGIHQDSEARVAPSVGVFFEAPISQRSTSELSRSGGLFFAPQVEYSMQGEYNKYPGGKQKFFADFINLPILLKYYFGAKANSGLNSSWFLTVGPKVGFIVNQKVSGDSINDPTTGINYIDLHFNDNDEFNKFDFGVVGGLGYAFDNHWQLMLRYDHGFTKMYDNTPHDKTTYNYKLGLSVNYGF